MHLGAECCLLSSLQGARNLMEQYHNEGKLDYGSKVGKENDMGWNVVGEQGCGAGRRERDRKPVAAGLHSSSFPPISPPPFGVYRLNRRHHFEIEASVLGAYCLSSEYTRLFCPPHAILNNIN